MVLLFPQQLQDEVPQLDLSGARARLRLVGPIREGKPWGTQERGEGVLKLDVHEQRQIQSKDVHDKKKPGFTPAL